MKYALWPIGILLLIIAGLLPGHTQAAPAEFSPQTVKQLYQDGEFEKVRVHLESFLKRSDATASREDRILAYKYLGVVYASKPEGAPQAEAYFFRLLDLSPQVQLTELYVSSSVNNIFERTQQRFIKEKQSAGAVDELGFPIAKGESSQPHKENLANSKAPMRNPPRQNQQVGNKGPRIWPWVLGAAVVGGGIGLYVLTSTEPEQKQTVVTGTVEN